jgi:polyisoprenoid-binding protein YceI
VKRPLFVLAAPAAAAVLFFLPAARAADAGAWQLSRGDVRVVCPLTVGGSFEGRTSSLAGTLSAAPGRPAAFAGAIEVDLRTLDTGIGLRNDHMRSEYLEVEKGEGFSSAVLTDLDLGSAPAEGLRGRTRFTGTLLLHGVRKAVSGQADIRREGQSVRVEAGFPIALADYGIRAPRYLGVGVKDVVQVKVSLTAGPDGPAASR